MSSQSKKCCVPGCTEKKEMRHRFPKNNPDLFQKWIDQVKSPKLTGLTRKQIEERYRVCHRHFSDHFKVISRTGLRVNAYPTLFLPGTEPDTPSSTQLDSRSENNSENDDPTFFNTNQLQEIESQIVCTQDVIEPKIIKVIKIESKSGCIEDVNPPQAIKVIKIERPFECTAEPTPSTTTSKKANKKESPFECTAEATPSTTPSKKANKKEYCKKKSLMEQFKKIDRTFFIAEIGQNHQGDIQIAKQLMNVAKDAGADCVKFQKSCLTEKFTSSVLKTPYSGKNSWGKTYGEHKSFLEFTANEFIELQKYAEELDIYFTASAMDPQSLKFLELIKVPFIKIGSGDANNLLLIEQAAKTNIPLVISTGMVGFKTVQSIYDLVSCYHKNFVLLHCTSAYPTLDEDVHLRVLKLYMKEFPDIPIGYSGHELGIHITTCAVALGAKVIERHITLDKTMKGTDHKCSLEPHELKQLISQIRSVELALGKAIKKRHPSEIPCYRKLYKTMVYSNNFQANHKLDSTNDIKVKVCDPKGLDPLFINKVLGKTLKCNVNLDDPVLLEHFL
ncbi:N-acetylneuraminic acid synthase isoform X3 [Rhynchophorus ferrugineus]|uniref:N-acetylneuraminic acid synthase isoform X3 n=1 Tax=Rhynchophorus ferrugineus TaxID=354439 RepID=UPI003FCC8FC0